MLAGSNFAYILYQVLNEPVIQIGWQISLSNDFF